MKCLSRSTFFLLALISLLFWSCDLPVVGLGDPVDIRAPEVTITNPSVNGMSLSTGESFLLSGKWKDNSGKIKTVTVRWIEGGVTERALVVDQNWSYDLAGFDFPDLGAQNFEVLATDPAGNSNYATRYIIIDNSSYTIRDVTAMNPNGNYKAGDVINIRVAFSKNIAVSAAPELRPRLLMNIGTERYAEYSSTDNNYLFFDFTVLPGDNSGSEELDYDTETALVVPDGGEILDIVENDGDLTLPPPGEGGSLSGNKNLWIDTLAPSVTGVSSPNTNTSYGSGAMVSIQMQFNETVVVSGSPSLALNTGGTAIYSSGSGSSVLTFNYIVSSGHNAADLDYADVDSLSLNGGSLVDLAVNPLVLTLPAPGASGSLGANKNIEIVTVQPDSPTVVGISTGSFNTNQSFTVTDIDPGAVAQYTLNSGVSWVDYSGAVVLSNEGVYLVGVRQRDPAGNVSDPSPIVTVTMDKTAPAAPFINGITGGNFGTAQSFQVFGEAGALLEYSTNNGANWTPYTVAVSLNPGAGNQASYSVLARQTDAAGNGPVTTAIPISISVDQQPPAIGSTLPAHNAMNVSVSGSLTLTFSETVYRESGTISLKRLYQRFPVVMTLDEYSEYRSRMTAGQKATLDSSYTLTTHGATSGVPDTTAVYVLNYSLEPDNSSLMTVFDSIGYNKIDIPVDSTQVTGSGTSSITITPSNPLPKGIHFYVEIPGTAFRDATGNLFAGISGDSVYRFTTGPVASPDIRVNKVSGSDTAQNPTTNYKISSPTQGALIRYISTEQNNTTATPSLPATPANPTSSSGTVYSVPVVLGAAADYTQGHTRWIKAVAYMSGDTLTASSVVEEVAFKTILRATADVSSGDEDRTSVWFRGSNNAGGPTTAAGFPLRWEEDQLTYIRLGQNVSGNWTWVTWEINTATQFKALRGNKPGDWATDGPLTFRWMAGLNGQVSAGGIQTVTPGWELNIQDRPTEDPPESSYSRTIVIDGTNDFDTAENRFDLTTASSYGYVSWDSTYLYLGMNHAEISSGSATEWVQIYLGGTAGTSSGTSYSGVQPTFPSGFNAQYQIRYKTDGSYTNVRTWNGSDWNTDWNPVSWVANLSKNASYFEIRVPLANLSDPTNIRLVMIMVDEGGTKKMFGGLPSSSFTDVLTGAGVIAVQKYLNFDRSVAGSPVVTGTILP